MLNYFFVVISNIKFQTEIEKQRTMVDFGTDIQTFSFDRGSSTEEITMLSSIASDSTTTFQTYNQVLKDSTEHLAAPYM